MNTAHRKLGCPDNFRFAKEKGWYEAEDGTLWEWEEDATERNIDIELMVKYIAGRHSESVARDASNLLVWIKENKEFVIEHLSSYN